jgi:pyruvate/2-oxoglutarate dehydrogenase complex dihydrolipoamide acyltransferase (E2) component
MPRVTPRGIEAREILRLTVLVDHDVVDGAPAARFLARLARSVEGGGAGSPKGAQGS